MPTGIYKRKPLSEETKQKISQAHTGSKNRNWKGGIAHYHSVHNWLYRKYGKASYCSNDRSHKSKLYEWANISGEYRRDITDYMPLCVSCHRKYDMTDELRKKMSDQRKGVSLIKNRRPVSQYTVEGSFLKTYVSLREASMETKIIRTAISNNLLGRSRTAGGYVWRA